MPEVLELEIGDGARREVQSQRRLVALVDEVPHVDSIRLRDEDNAWSSRREGTTSVVRTESVRRTENRVVEIVTQGGLPNAEVEVVHGQDQVFKEGRSLKCDDRTIAALAFIYLADVLSKLCCIFTSTSRWLDTPVNLNKVTFIR